MSKTIDYYDKYAQEFYDRTINADISRSYDAFLSHLPERSYIIDAGCGVGRDSKYFLSQGHQVAAFDASERMVAMASVETGIKAMRLTFQDMSFNEIFDGIWAQASLLHIPYRETRDVYQKMHRALKPGGLFYASYKYGNNYMKTQERDFWNMDEQSVRPYFNGIFDVVKIWKEKDMRSKVSPGQSGMWLNFIVRKT